MFKGTFTIDAAHICFQTLTNETLNEASLLNSRANETTIAMEATIEDIQFAGESFLFFAVITPKGIHEITLNLSPVHVYTN